MNQKRRNDEVVRKVALIGILTALATVLSYIKIPVVSTATVTLVLPVVVIGAIVCGTWVGAWLTVIPALTSFGEAALFLTYNPFGTVLTLMLKGLLAGYLAGLVYKLMSKKHPTGGVICAAVVAPVVNTSVFVLGCYIFIWSELVALAAENGVGIGMLLFGLAGMNFIIELILNVVLCPAIIRIIELAAKKNFLKK
ncbi:MAG: ECF transporter S component [Clostridia bacterium]|nr:ECF transporter S component [Clostridia bacterium]